MGRTRTKKNVAAKPAEAKTRQSVVPSRQPSIPALLEKAQALIVQCDYDLAQRFARRVLEQEHTNVQAKEMLGVALLELGEITASKEVFMSLIPPYPGAPSPPPPSAHLYLAQLSEDDPRAALQHYQAAIDILSSQLKGKDRVTKGIESSDEAEIRTNIIRALIGQVEIWMDPSYDLCFEVDAETTCEKLIELALQTDPGNSEALQALASVRMSQQRPNDAKDCLERAWSVWKDLDLEDPRVPSISVRLALVKLFLELHLFNAALVVLQGVMSSDDQEVEAWYLEGWCFFMMAEQARESGGKLDDLNDLTWEELAQDCRNCLETCKMLHVNEGHPDTPLLEHVKELISQLELLGIMPSHLEDENDALEDDWEEESDGDVDME